MTSYPPRFPTLAATLRCLLSQSVRPDHLILWIASADYDQLPRNVTGLVKFGLEIRRCEDWRSYKKIIPCLSAFPEAFIATADDDTDYPRHWLKGLVDTSRSTDFLAVVCHRARRIRLGEGGLPLPYRQWEGNTKLTGPSRLLLATGLGGVLYPPHVLHPAVLDSATFLRLAPNADDVWLYWMASLRGTLVAQTGVRQTFVNWPHSQANSLWSTNKDTGSGNDSQIVQMIERYGLPFLSGTNP